MIGGGSGGMLPRETFLKRMRYLGCVFLHSEYNIGDAVRQNILLYLGQKMPYISQSVIITIIILFFYCAKIVLLYLSAHYKKKGKILVKTYKMVNI